jgi:NTE family protein
VLRIFVIGFGLLLLSGCASYGVIDNAQLSTESSASPPYSIKELYGRKGSGDIGLTLAFSGGGTRAAALAYGVLEELRDTTVVIDGQPRRLLDEVDTISSVSGGSFTSAYYGLYGDRIFEDFKHEFLTRDIEHKLFLGLFNPLRWFSSEGRTEMAVRLYQEQLFHGSTFADMQRADAPLILINASDLGYGVRFSFVQEYFDLLCSDLSSFPVARAVAASSAVPVLFNPVVVKDYQECPIVGKPDWMERSTELAVNNPALEQIIRSLETYSDKSGRDYAHLVDGGITDNLGLRAVYEVLELAGGPRRFFDKTRAGRHPRYAAVISVNASTDPEPAMDKTNRQPSIAETIGSMSSVQLHRYNDATINLMQQSMTKWTQALSTPARPITSYFVNLGFTDIEEPERRRFFNAIPTSFSLTEEQIDGLIEAGHELLRNDPGYQQLLADLGGAQVPNR